jgi:hypothetical protein
MSETGELEYDRAGEEPRYESAADGDRGYAREDYREEPHGDRGDRGGYDRGDRGGYDRSDHGGYDRGDRGGYDRGDRGGYDRGHERRPRGGELYRPKAAKPNALDHQGLRIDDGVEPQEEVLYTVTDEPAFNPTRALFIGNLRRPINANEFQQFLRQLLRDSGGNYVVERAWLNRTRTHGIVLVDREEGADYLRQQLNGSIYPRPEDDVRLREEFDRLELERYNREVQEYESRKQELGLDDAAMESEDRPSLEPPRPLKEFQPVREPLYVDYIPVKAINQWIFEEDKGPRNGKWKIVYELPADDPSAGILATHVLLNGDFVPRYTGRQPRGGRRGGSFGSGGRRGTAGRYGGGRGSYGRRDGGYDRYDDYDGYDRRYPQGPGYSGRDRGGYNSFPGRPTQPTSYGGRDDYDAPPYPQRDHDRGRRGPPPRSDRDTYIPRPRSGGDSYVPRNRDYSDYRDRDHDRERSRSRSPARPRSPGI